MREDVPGTQDGFVLLASPNCCLPQRAEWSPLPGRLSSLFGSLREELSEAVGLFFLVVQRRAAIC